MGYSYSHWVSSDRRIKSGAAIHVAILIGTFAVLPFKLPENIERVSESPVLSLLGVLICGIGLPFFALSATAPLLQKWFSRLNDKRAGDPYFLYSASNAGSLLALLGYPFLLEPTLTLARQRELWAWGFLAFTVLLGICAVALVRTSIKIRSEKETRETIPWVRKIRWVALSFIPSSLMLGVTTYITTDVASIPLLWILPLSVYLLTFILVFSDKFSSLQKICVRLLPFTVVASTLIIALHTTTPLALILSIHFLTFFVIAMVCHGRLAQDRPSATQLTQFYFWMSVGGVLGGIFNALIAPVIFQSVFEFPLVLAAACLVLPLKGAFSKKSFFAHLALQVLLAGVLLLAFSKSVPVYKILLCLYGFMIYISYHAPPRMASAVFILMALSHHLWIGGMSVNEIKRSFFGVSVVMEKNMPDGRRYKMLMHGTTNHGVQMIAPEKAVAGYYDSGSPVVAVYSMIKDSTPAANLGVIGMGPGAMATFIRSSDRMDFYEIDPVVKEIALNPEHFTFISESASHPNVILGDGRLEIQKMPTAYYDGIFLDAFSSDSIPLHLLTRDAVKMYLSKLKDNGVLIFHISNRYFDLERSLTAIADSLDLKTVYLTRFSKGDLDIMSPKATFVFSSKWMVMARNEDILRPLKEGPFATKNTAKPVSVWTDDYSNLLSILK